MRPQETPKKATNAQLNLNTFLLATCVGLSGWALKSIEDLKVLAGRLTERIAHTESGILSENQVQQEQSEKIGVLFNRLTVVETIQSDHSHKK